MIQCKKYKTVDINGLKTLPQMIFALLIEAKQQGMLIIGAKDRVLELITEYAKSDNTKTNTPICPPSSRYQKISTSHSLR